tara:strand:+ start:364 stop:1497 length:1134 start_codon:yes stop_codon:yes gene_type:complete
MASFKKGLMEFGEGFLLSFGDTVATNIAEKAKQDRADILSTTKDLKTRIKAGKTADSKLKMKYMERGNDILATLPGLDSNTLRNALASPEYGKALLAQAKADTLGNAEWYKPIAKQLGLENANPYTNKKDRKPLSTLIKEFRTGPISKKDDKAKDEDTMAEDTIRTIFGGGMSPEAIIRAGGKRLGARFSPEEIERYGGAGYVPQTITSKNVTSVGTPTKANATLRNSVITASTMLQGLPVANKGSVTGKDIVFNILKTNPMQFIMKELKGVLQTDRGATASEEELLNYLMRKSDGLLNMNYLTSAFKDTNDGKEFTYTLDGTTQPISFSPLTFIRKFRTDFNESVQRIDSLGDRITKESMSGLGLGKKLSAGGGLK